MKILGKFYEGRVLFSIGKLELSIVNRVIEDVVCCNFGRLQFKGFTRYLQKC